MLTESGLINRAARCRCRLTCCKGRGRGGLISTSTTLPSCAAYWNVNDSRTQSGTGCGPWPGFTVNFSPLYPSLRKTSALFTMTYIRFLP
jgi:hypothetical protein